MLKFIRLSRKQRFFLIALTTAIILAIIYTALRNNIHTVIPGKIYRSAQLSPTAINRIAHIKHIKSIINLRGKNPAETWYQDEIKESKALHLQHYDIALNSTRQPSQAQLLRLSNLLTKAPKPILIHCASGVDRTGFASALALILLDKTPPSAAQNQFSWHYLVFSQHSIGKLVFASYKDWQHKHHLKNTADTFKQFLQAVG